jgi:parvulin-like peptidyl-prolyl isomerase
VTRRFALGAALLAVLAVAASGCGGSGVGPAAAVVNGTAISRAEFEDALRQYRANGRVDVASFGVSSVGGAGESVDADFARALLDRYVNFTVIGQEVERLGLRADDPSITATADPLAPQLAGGQEAFEAFTDEATRDRVRQWARDYFALGVAASGQGLDTTSLEALLAKDPRRVCISHLLVATEDEALAAKRRIDRGESFADVAREVSTDPGSSASGGELRRADGSCDLAAAVAVTYVPEFASAVQGAPVGTVIGPVATQFGFHLLTITEAEPVQFAAVEDDLRQAAIGAVFTAAQGEIQRLLDRASIRVDSRYGTWNAAQRFIEPPRGTRRDLPLAPRG